MNTPIWRLGRAAFSVLLLITILCAPGLAQEDSTDLPFHLKVKKAEFEKKLRAGLTQVLSQYVTTLDALANRDFTEEAAEGVAEVKREKERFGRQLPEIENADPLEFVSARIGRLNRDEVELESHLAESTWQLTDGRVLKLLRNGGVLFDGKRDANAGWEIAGPHHFVWGGKYWKSEVRDRRRRFNATAWRTPRKSLQGVFIDSVDYNGAPVPLMAREFGKMKLQLATGLKVLIKDYATALDQSRKAQLQAGELDEALAAKKQWEKLYETSDFLFGTEVDLGDPSESIRPGFETVEALRAGLIGSSWRLSDGQLLTLRARGHAEVAGKGFPLHRNWEALDHRTILFGWHFRRVRF